MPEITARCRLPHGKSGMRILTVHIKKLNLPPEASYTMPVSSYYGPQDRGLRYACSRIMLTLIINQNTSAKMVRNLFGEQLGMKLTKMLDPDRPRRNVKLHIKAEVHDHVIDLIVADILRELRKPREPAANAAQGQPGRNATWYIAY